MVVKHQDLKDQQGNNLELGPLNKELSSNSLKPLEWLAKWKRFSSVSNSYHSANDI